MEKELVVVIDFGGQYNQLVARRVRECNVYCEIYSYKTDLNKIKAMNPKGIILTGGPASCYEPGAATCSEDLFHLGVPVLGLCYGAQLMTHVLGGKVERAAVREYGKTEVKAIEILRGLAPRYEEHHHVKLTDGAVTGAVRLAARYVNDRFLPDKAIDAIDEACARAGLKRYMISPELRGLEEEQVQLEKEKEQAIRSKDYTHAGEVKRRQEQLEHKIDKIRKEQEKHRGAKELQVTENEIAAVIADWTKIPVQKLQEEEMERLRHLEEILHERVVGQEEAVSAVSKAVRRGRVGLKDPRRPIGSFLFLGPTGVGKTTTIAKVASRFKVDYGKKVAFLTADTYRIAAAEQLRTYANILDTPLTVIYSSEEMNAAIERVKDYDLVLVDTAGFSYKNEDQRKDMRNLIESLDDKYEKDVYLVLSATTKYRDLMEIVDKYHEISDYKIIFTKLDETSSYGSLLNIRMYSGADVSYVTTGQNVPDDIEIFQSQKIVKQLLGGR